MTKTNALNPYATLRHICNEHKALLQGLTLQKSLNWLCFLPAFVFQLNNRKKHWATEKTSTPMPTTTHIYL